nr:complement factor H-related protein 2-like [Nerophis lumbriciformis]
MFCRCLGFVLLLSFPGLLHGQTRAESCAAPQLDGGFLVPEQDSYLHESSLAYACNAGQKPAVEGWWATSVCLNGLWSHTPQCIDENACFTPDVPHGKYGESPEGLWYKEGSVIRIKCDEGYKHKTWGATATCRKGAWSSLPVCERSETSCNEPPNIPHGVVLHKYQHIFEADSEIHYGCEDGYSVEGTNARKSISCVAGMWTEVPSCKKYKPFTLMVTHSSADMSLGEFKAKLRNFEAAEDSDAVAVEAEERVLKARAAQKKKTGTLTDLTYGDNVVGGGSGQQTQQDDVLKATGGDFSFRALPEDASQSAQEFQRTGLVVDTGVLSHIMNNRNQFKNFNSNFKPERHSIELADGKRTFGLAQGRGDTQNCSR